MKKQTNKNRKSVSRPQLNSKALKDKSDTRVPDNTRKSVRDAKKRLRYYFLSMKQRQDVQKFYEGRESLLSSINSLGVVYCMLFFNYVVSSLDISIYQCRALFCFFCSPDGSLTLHAYLSASCLTDCPVNRNNWELSCGYLLSRGLLERVSSRVYVLSEYSYYVLEQLLKDFKDLHISTPSAVDSRHA